MTDSTTLPVCEPYVLHSGEGLSHLVAGQVIRTLAGVEQTAGGFGVVTCDASIDRMPIPMHWHEREHDTWLVTRGRLKVWCKDEARIMAPGDFAYVVPGDGHSYRSVAPRTQFLGVIAPGGWEEFFVDAGEVWGMTAMPPADRPFDFSRMGPAMAKHRIMRIEDPVYVEATAIGPEDQALPEGHASYWLEAGFGTRRVFAGHLSTAVLTAAQSGGLIDMRTIEGGRAASLPAIRHASTHVFLFVLDGVLELDIAGKTRRLTSGDCANIPAGTSYATRIASGAARWVAVSAGGDGGGFWDALGEEAAGYSHPAEHGGEAEAARLGGDHGLDVALA